jgi:hypothetical protein
MKRLILLLAVVFAACVPYKPPVATPPVTPKTMVVYVEVYDDTIHAKVSGVSVKYWFIGEATTAVAQVTNSDGNTSFTVPATTTDSHMWTSGDVTYLESAQHVDAAPFKIVAFHLTRRPPPDADPSTIPLTELAAIRGAMWTVPGPWRFGPRPGQLDNLTAMEFIYSYGDDPRNLSDEQNRMLAAYKAPGYTHVAFGPPNAQSYHGLWPDIDFTTGEEAFGKWLDWLQMFYNHQLKPIIFMHPDNATFEETRVLWERLVSYDPVRAKLLMRILVPSGWEPTRYDWSSRTWGLYFDWAHALFPDALILAHTVTDVDAMVGTDALYDDNGKGNDAGWRYIAPKIHGWLTQSAAFSDPTAIEPSSGRTRYEEWWRMYDKNTNWSYYGRFHNGYAGWPTSSLWGPTTPVRIYAAEYCSYWVTWQGRSYNECVAWGDRAMKVGADGYLDGGSVPVPVIK